MTKTTNTTKTAFQLAPLFQAKELLAILTLINNCIITRKAFKCKIRTKNNQKDDLRFAYYLDEEVSYNY